MFWVLVLFFVLVKIYDIQDLNVYNQRAQWCLDGENVRALEPWSSIFGWFIASPNHLSAVLQAEWLQCWGNFNTHTGTILISDQSISVMKSIDQYCTRFPYTHELNVYSQWKPEQMMIDKCIKTARKKYSIHILSKLLISVLNKIVLFCLIMMSLNVSNYLFEV